MGWFWSIAIFLIILGVINKYLSAGSENGRTDTPPKLGQSIKEFASNVIADNEQNGAERLRLHVLKGAKEIAEQRAALDAELSANPGVKKIYDEIMRENGPKLERLIKEHYPDS